MNEKQVANNFLLLLKLVDGGRTSLESRKKSTERKAFWMKLAILCITAGITLVLGLNLGTVGSNVALALSFVLTILNGMDQFLNITTRHKVLLRRLGLLVKLELDLTYYLDNNNKPTEDKFLEFKNRYDEILNEAIENTVIEKPNVSELSK